MQRCRELDGVRLSMVIVRSKARVYKFTPKVSWSSGSGMCARTHLREAEGPPPTACPQERSAQRSSATVHAERNDAALVTAPVWVGPSRAQTSA